MDGERGMLVGWYWSEEGVVCERRVSDGGRAIQEALSYVQRLDRHQRDVWHVLHAASQVQGRCDRALHQLQDRLAVIQRQAERVAQGQKARGRAPEANVVEHEQSIERTKYVTQALRYLAQELHTLLDVVVLGAEQQVGLLTSRDRQQELEDLLALLGELAEQALPTVQKQIQSLAKQLRLALPHLLLFAADLDVPQQQACERLGPRAVSLLAWAWQRRALLCPSTKGLFEC